MTQFDKSKFTYHGGYLMYHGTYEGQPTYDEYYGKDKIHPSRIGMPVELFIARFKYQNSKVVLRTSCVNTSQLKNLLHDTRMVNHL